MNYFLGIDIGTTNIKAVIFNTSWQNIFYLEKKIKTLYPSNGCCEQEPKQILNSTNKILKEALEYAKKDQIKIKAVGLSTAMHSFLPVDKNLEPLSNMAIWSDTRSVSISDSLKKNSTVKKYFEKSNLPVHPMLPLTKWLWFNQYSGQAKKVFKILSFKEFLIVNWFGEFITDRSMASSMGYYDLKANDWNFALLQYLKLDTQQLSDVVPTTTVLEAWSDEARKKIGLTDLPPVVIGSSDGCLANLAAGITDNTKASLTIGTSGAVRTAYDKPDDFNSRLFCYPVLDDYFVVGGAVNNGGNIVEWFKNNLFNQSAGFWRALESAIGKISPGSDGLFFFPYLLGERAPIWDPNLKGSYVGITNAHNNEHFLKASLEGIGFTLKHIFELVDSRPNTIKQLIVDGGFTKSEAWIQLMCDMIGVEVFCPKTTFGAAKGAAMLAKIAVDDDILERIIVSEKAEGKTYKPDSLKNKRYENLFLHYLNISSALISM